MKWTEELTLTEVLQRSGVCCFWEKKRFPLREKKEAATQSLQSVTAQKKINLLLV